MVHMAHWRIPHFSTRRNPGTISPPKEKFVKVYSFVIDIHALFLVS